MRSSTNEFLGYLVVTPERTRSLVGRHPLTSMTCCLQRSILSLWVTKSAGWPMIATSKHGIITTTINHNNHNTAIVDENSIRLRTAHGSLGKRNSQMEFQTVHVSRSTRMFGSSPTADPMCLANPSGDLSHLKICRKNVLQILAARINRLAGQGPYPSCSHPKNQLSMVEVLGSSPLFQLVDAVGAPGAPGEHPITSCWDVQ